MWRNVFCDRSVGGGVGGERVLRVFRELWDLEVGVLFEAQDRVNDEVRSRR